MSETFERRYPVDQAVDVIAERLAHGWSLLGVEGLWVESESVRPDLDYIFDGSPDGVRDADEAVIMLASWPRDDAFCVELLMVR